MGCGSSHVDSGSRFLVEETVQGRTTPLDLESFRWEDEDKYCNLVFQDVLGQYRPSFDAFPTNVILKVETLWYASLNSKRLKLADGTFRPCPAVQRKADIFQAQKFEKLDNFALEAPRDMLQRSLNQVVRFLTHNKKSVLEKVRMLYRWAAAQDLKVLAGCTDTKTMQGRLSEIKEERSNHGQLMYDLLRAAGITCYLVTGITKAAGYEVGQDMDFSQFRNRWIAVLIGQEWKFIDLNFACRSQVGGGNGQWELIDDNGRGFRQMKDSPVGITYEINDFYFLTDPEEFIYNHFPEHEQWQLLARTITSVEFQQMAHVTGAFFELGLGLTESTKKCVLYTIDGEVELVFGLPENGSRRRFMYQLWRERDDEQPDYSGYEQCVYVEQSQGLLTCRVVLPSPGKHKFHLFARNSDKDSSESTQYFSMCAVYLIICDEAKPNFNALPKNQRREWGPAQDIAEVGMTPVSHKAGTIETDSGYIEIVFDTVKPITLIAELTSENKMITNMLPLWYLIRSEHGQAVVYVRLQKKGTYTLQLFAKHKEEPGESVPSVCTYLLVSTEDAIDQIVFPAIHHQICGTTEKAQTFGLVSEMHKESHFVTNNGEETFVFTSKKQLDFVSKLSMCTEGTREELKNHVMYTKKASHSRSTFTLSFPRPGMYEFVVYAKEILTEGAFESVHCYVIRALTAKEGCMPYPEIFNGWNEGCEAYGALKNGFIPADEQLPLQVKVPNAEDVAVIPNNEDLSWQHFKREKGDIWTGQIDTGKVDNFFKVSAKLKSTLLFTGLLGYHVKSKKSLGTLKETNEKDMKIENNKRKQEEQLRKQKEAELKEIRQKLQQAIESRNLEELKQAVLLVEKQNYTERLKEAYLTAKRLIRSFTRIQRLKSAILKMDKGIMLEIRNYKEPPKLVHEVMCAALLLLGESEDKTSEWRMCQAFCNSNTLNKKVQQFEVADLHPQIAARARNMLKGYRLEDVREKSEGAAGFYAWVIGMVEELEIQQKGATQKTKPADVKRQKEIFKKKK